MPFNPTQEDEEDEFHHWALATPKMRWNLHLPAMDRPVRWLSEMARRPLPDYGLFQLSIDEAAELTVTELWFSGAIDPREVPPEYHYSTSYPISAALSDALAGQRALFVKRLLDSINAGRLQATQENRDWNEALDPAKTFVHVDALTEWIKERCNGVGRIFERYQKSEQRIKNHLWFEADALRTFRRKRAREGDAALYRGVSFTLDDIQNLDHGQAIAAVRALALENALLLDECDAQPSEPAEQPLSTRKKNTLYTLIAALCAHARIDPAARGASQRLRSMTEELGTPVDDGTIRKVLDEIPDALATRMK